MVISPLFPLPAEQNARTLSDRLSEALITAVVRGEIPAGARVNEQVLARRFDVSRGPLREAIRRLEGLHLVTRVPHAGARVVTLDAAQLSEIYEMREALEGMAARLAARNMGDAEVADLKALLDAHERQIEAAGGSEYYQREGDFDIHYRIIRGSGNARITSFLCGELYHLVRMFRYRSSLVASRPQRALAEHRAITEAIEQHDEELAEMLMRRHIGSARRSIEKQLAAQGEKYPAGIKPAPQDG
ncbi:MAG: GntR family transcriptional regulator [Gammaproteobacteria bacterium]|nr:GntR family transcriptional regulator [Gammaproteobacteria bacterium]